VGSLFAAFLGYNPMQQLLGPNVLNKLPADKAQYLTGKTFFPHLISDPFKQGLVVVFTASLLMCLVAAGASWLRGALSSAGPPTDSFGMPQGASPSPAESPKLSEDFTPIVH
jgi:hypothetical protein